MGSGKLAVGCGRWEVGGGEFPVGCGISDVGAVGLVVGSWWPPDTRHQTSPSVGFVLDSKTLL